MKTWLLMVTMLAVAAMALLATPPAYATDVSGDQSGSWTLASSPYVVTAKVIVPAGKALTIEPGVTVKFNQGVRGYQRGPGHDQSGGGLVAQHLV